MRTGKWVAGLLVLLVLLAGPAAPQDEQPDPEKLFQEGIRLAGEGKHAEALEKYRAILEQYPDATGVLYNAGLSAYLSGKFEPAGRWWSRLKELDPEDWQVRSKLVQTWQALEKKEERDREIAGLYRLRSTTDDEDLKSRKFYCRDQFVVGKRRVIVLEHFELEGDRAIRWYFGVNGENGEKEYHLSLGSYKATNEMMRASGQLEEGQRGYHLDGYHSWGHATYGFYRGEPDYEDIRTQVVGIVEGKVEPISSSRRGTGSGDEAPGEEK